MTAAVATKAAPVPVDSSPEKVMLAGDWHGSTHWALSALEQALARGADTVIQVGDFGWWVEGDFTREYLGSLQRFVHDTGLDFYWLDGNHEDHSREFTDERYPDLTYLPRGYRWSWWDKTWMSVGGAVSVDKAWRKEGVSWWPNEILTEEEVYYASRPPGVDIVLAHDCPKGVDIPGIGPNTKQRPGEMRWPVDALARAEAHREKMRHIWKATRPTLWVHGHYHRRYEAWLRETRFIGLDCDGSQGWANIMFLTKDGVEA